MPEERAYWLELASRLREEKRYEEAYQAINRFLEKHPGSYEGLGILGGICSQWGRLEEAEQTYFRCLELKPDHPFALYNLGTNYIKMGREQDAAKFMFRSLEAKSDNMEGWYNLACVYARLEQKSSALNALERAFSLDAVKCRKALSDMDFSKLRKEPEAKELFQRIEEGR